MTVVFMSRAWDEYVSWSVDDGKMLKRVNGLIAECRRTPFGGTGKPEPLRDNLKGWWSRRITQEHRLVYRVVGSGDDQRLEIVQCRYHY